MKTITREQYNELDALMWRSCNERRAEISHDAAALDFWRQEIRYQFERFAAAGFPVTPVNIVRAAAFRDWTTSQTTYTRDILKKYGYIVA